MKLETNLLESAGQVSAQAGGKVGREERERQWELIRQIIKAEMRRHDDMSERAWTAFLALLRSGGKRHFTDTELLARFEQLSPEDREDILTWMRLRTARTQSSES